MQTQGSGRSPSGHPERFHRSDIFPDFLMAARRSAATMLPSLLLRPYRPFFQRTISATSFIDFGPLVLLPAFTSAAKRANKRSATSGFFA